MKQKYLKNKKVKARISVLIYDWQDEFTRELAGHFKVTQSEMIRKIVDFYHENYFQKEFNEKNKRE